MIHLHESAAVQVVSKSMEVSTAQANLKGGGRQNSKNSKMTPNDSHPCISPSSECIWNVAKVIGYHFHDYITLYSKGGGAFAQVIKLPDQLT